MKHRALFGVAAALAIVAAACGSDNSKSSSGATATTAPSGAATSASASSAAAASSATTQAVSTLPAQITIGVPQDTSGNAAVAVAGKGELDGTTAAAKEINDSGFLGTTKLKLNTVDTKGDKQASVEAVLGFIDQKVDSVVGFSLTASYLAAAPQLQTAQIPTIAVGAAASGVTEVGDYMFRMYPNTTVYIPAADVDFVKAFNAKTAAYLTQSDNSAAAALTPARKAALEALGVKTVAEQTFATTDTDVRAQLTAIKGAHPDVVLASMVAGSQTIVYLQAQEIGLGSQIIGASGVTDAILQQAGKAMQCSVAVEPWVAQSTAGNNPHFIQYWQQQNPNTPPNVFNAIGYSAMWSMAQAFKKAGTVDHAAVRNALATIDAIDTPVGTINFKTNRDPMVKGTKIQYQNSAEALWDPSKPCTK
jgi:branched-chain amino acid transport system substrate-binding protein